MLQYNSGRQPPQFCGVSRDVIVTDVGVIVGKWFYSFIAGLYMMQYLRVFNICVNYLAFFICLFLKNFICQQTPLLRLTWVKGDKWFLFQFESSTSLQTYIFHSSFFFWLFVCDVFSELFALSFCLSAAYSFAII